MDDLLIVSSICRVTGTLSTLGSFLIISMILSDRERKLVRPYQRIMLLMSIFDVFQSVAFLISVTALPQESNISGAKGNLRTCVAQGFFMTLGLAVPLCNLNLNIFYLLTVRYNFSVQEFVKFEPVMTAVPILIPLSIAIITTVNGDMEPRSTICYPHGRFALLFLTAIILVCFLVCILSMALISRTVITRSATLERYIDTNRQTSSTANNHIEEDKKKAIRQAFVYTLAFVATYTCPILQAIYRKGRSEIKGPFVLIILSAILYPLQGFWNFLFYVRPVIEYVKEANPDMPFLRVFREAVFNSGSESNCQSRR